MNHDKLQSAISAFIKNKKANAAYNGDNWAERKKRKTYYQSFTKAKSLAMTEDAFVEYLSRLWSMLMWGNKRFLANKLIADNGFDVLKKQLAELPYGSVPVEKRVCSGTILCGILPGELSNVPWPLFESRVQRDIVTRVQSSFVLRAESKRLLEKAKAMGETAIEQGENDSICVSSI